MFSLCSKDIVWFFLLQVGARTLIYELLKHAIFIQFRRYWGKQRGFITMFKVLTFCELNSSKKKNSISVVSWNQFRGKETHWDKFIYFMPEPVFKIVFILHCSHSKARNTLFKWSVFLLFGSRLLCYHLNLLPT